MNIGSLIRSKREELKYTMKQVAVAVGVSEGTVSRWESGEIENMKRNNIAKLSEVLDIPIYKLMEWDAPEDRTDKFIERMKKYSSALSESEKAQIIMYVEFLASKKENENE